MWYYIFNQSKYGPVDDEKLIELFDIRTINSQTMVQKDGAYEWIRFEDTDLYQSYMKAKVLPKKLKANFIWWIVLDLLYIVGVYFGDLIFPHEADVSSGIQIILSVLFVLFLLVGIALAIIQMILLYRLWQVIQDGYQRTTPGKAVGYLFIPFYWFYWKFRAYWGFSKETNQYIDRHFILKPELKVRKSKQWISLFATIIGTFGLVAFVQMYMNGFYSLMETGNLNIYQSTATYFEYMQPIIIMKLIFYSLNWLFLSASFIDFYLTTRSILKAEESNNRKN
jgi:hypothetical protein